MNAFVKTEIASSLAGILNLGTVVFAISDTVAIALISGVVSLGAAYFSYKAKKTSEATHEAVNSRLDVFMKTAEAAFKAEGIAKERTEERERQGQVAMGVAEQLQKDKLTDIQKPAEVKTD